MNAASLPLWLSSAALLAATSVAAADASTAAPVQKVVIRASAHFGFDQAELAPADRDRILAEVGKIKDVSWQTVTATGHTDSVGARRYNELLSQRRAEAVKTYLVGQGVDGSIVNVQAKADAAPAADNHTPAGRARNRRTDITFEGVRVAAP